MDFSKFSLETDIENEIKINIELYIESKADRPQDQPEACEIETLFNVLSEITRKCCVLNILKMELYQDSQNSWLELKDKWIPTLIYEKLSVW